MTDEKLVKRVARGDSTAFRKLFDLYSGKVFGCVKHALGNNAKAEEMSQEVWMTAIRRAGVYKPTKTCVSWLLDITRETARQESTSSEQKLYEEEVRPEHRDRVLALAEKELDRYRAKLRRFILSTVGVGAAAAISVMVKNKIIDAPPAIEGAALQANLLKDFEILKDFEFFEDLNDAVEWQELLSGKKSS